MKEFNHPLLIIVDTNSDCTKRCPNCYVSHDSFKPLSLEMAEKVGTWLTDVFRDWKIPYVWMNFLGGETLLNIKAVAKVMDIIKQRTPKIIIPWSARVYTNGDLLTPEIFQWFRDTKMSIGFNPTYDSLEEVERKMKLIKDNKIFKILAVPLDDLNLERLPELTKLCLKYQFLMKTNRLYEGGNIPGYVDKYKEAMKKMFKILLEADHVMSPNFIVDTVPIISSILQPPDYYEFYRKRGGHSAPKTDKVFRMGCGHWTYMIGTDGTIYSCNPDKSTVIGSIFTHFKENDFDFSFNRHEALPECMDCEWVEYCNSGCPYTRKVTYGTYEKRTPLCSALKEIWPLVIELADKFKRVNGIEEYAHKWQFEKEDKIWACQLPTQH